MGNSIEVVAFYGAATILSVFCNVFAAPWQDYQSYAPDTNYQMPGISTPMQQPFASRYPTNNQQPVLTSSWQESQKSGSMGYQGPMMSPAYDQRNNIYPTSSYGANQSPSVYTPTPSYGHDQRNYGYPNTGYVQPNISPQYQTPNIYANNYGYTPSYTSSYTPNYNSRGHNYVPSNAGLSPGYDQRNYGYPSSVIPNNYPVQHQQNTMPNYGSRNYDSINPRGVDSNYFNDQNNFAYSPNAYNPRNDGYPSSESHIESSFDQRNFGHSTESRHETHSQPQTGDIHSYY